MRIELVIILLFWIYPSFSQPNCNVYEKGSDCEKACLAANIATTKYAGSRSFQKGLLKAIELCPTYHHAYFELSVNYAKRGLMHEWLPLINKAVDLSPLNHLGWRGWYHWFFMNNYEKAIADIERLDSLQTFDIGTTGDGLYHLNILKGLCYKKLGNTEKALGIILQCMEDEEYYQGSYDYLHLGVLYLELDQPLKALSAFETQNNYNEVSEGYFYSAKAHLQMDNHEQAFRLFQQALEAYQKERAMHDPYRQLIDEIYLVDIESEMEAMTK